MTFQTPPSSPSSLGSRKSSMCSISSAGSSSGGSVSTSSPLHQAQHRHRPQVGHLEFSQTRGATHIMITLLQKGYASHVWKTFNPAVFYFNTFLLCAHWRGHTNFFKLGKLFATAGKSLIVFGKFKYFISHLIRLKSKVPIALY